MKPIILIILALALLAPTTAFAQDALKQAKAVKQPDAVKQANAVKTDLKKLQGTWARIYVIANGKKFEDGKEIAEGKITEDGKQPEEGKQEPANEITLTIDGDKYGGETFQIDPSKNPKQINVSMRDENGKPTTLPGIYELQDDLLKLCFPFPFEEKIDKLGIRPAKFDGPAGGNDVLEVYKRKSK